MTARKSHAPIPANMSASDFAAKMSAYRPPAKPRDRYMFPMQAFVPGEEVGRKACATSHEPLSTLEARQLAYGKPKSKRANPAAKPRGLERDLLRAVLDALALVPGVKAIRMQSGARPAEYKGKTRMIRMHEAGTPDLLVLLPHGKCMFIELKRDAKAKLSEAQAAWHAQAHALGQVVTVQSTVQGVLLRVKLEKSIMCMP